MSKDLEEFGFEPIEAKEESVEDLSEFGFESDEDEMSQTEAGLRGAAQGLTLDFGDEIAGGLKAALMKGGGSERELLEMYKKTRDAQRAANKEAQETYPKTYMAGDIGAGIIPAIFSGGTSAAAGLGKAVLKGGLKEASKKAAKTGAKYGAVAGLGRSEGEDLAELAQDTATGAVGGAALGSALPVAAKGAGKLLQGGKDLLSKAGSKAEEIVKIAPVAKEAVEAYKLAAKGKNVLGETNYQQIIDDSKSIVKKQLKPLLVSENQKFSSAIGKVLKKVDKVGGKKDLSKQLVSIEKQVANLLESGKAPTDESKVVLGELLNTINQFKQEVIKVNPTKKVETGVQKAIASLTKQQNKIAKTAEEVGERVNFTEPKIDMEKGIASVFESETGRVLTSPIKTGEMTPIKFSKESQFQDLGANQLKGLKDAAYEVLAKAKKGDVGVAKKPIGKLYGAAKDATEELAEDAKLASAMKESNKGFSQIRNVDDILPESLLKGDEKSIYKVAQFLRKAEIEGIGGDELRDRLVHFSDELKNVNPKFAEKFLKKSAEIAQRYELARTARQSFGLNLGTGKALGVMTGSLVGGTKKVATDVVDRTVGKVANKVVNLTDDVSRNLSQKMLNSSSKGIQSFGRQLDHALKQDDTVKSSLLWALSQQPAFRQATKQFVDENNDNMMQDLSLETKDDSDASKSAGDTAGKVPYAYGMREQEPETTQVEAPKSGRSPASEKEYFNPQTSEVNLEVSPSLLDTVKKVGTEFGQEGLTISSGKRTEEKTREIMEQRKKKFGLDDFSPEDQKLIDQMMLRGESPDSVIYSNRGDLNTDIDNLFPERADELKEKFRKLRLEFGGYSSQHLAGDKIDIPYSHFVDKYGKEEGTLKAKEFIEKLREAGLKVIDEPNAGRHGVIDIQEIQKNKDRESVQLGAGASGDQRSSLDDLMGSIQSNEGIDTQDKQDMQDKAYDGDMEGLQALINKYNGTMS